MSVDATGVHIAYVRFSGWSLQYSHRPTVYALWETTELAELASRFPSLALDASGGVHVVYATQDAMLVHAHRAIDPDGAWTASVVDAVPGANQPSLAVASTGAVHISYYANGDLRHAEGGKTPPVSCVL